MADEPVPVGCHAFAVPVEPPTAPRRAVRCGEAEGSGGVGGSRRLALVGAELAKQFGGGLVGDATTAAWVYG